VAAWALPPRALRVVSGTNRSTTFPEDSPVSDEFVPTLTSLWSPAFEALVKTAKPSYAAKHEALCAMGVMQTDQLEVRNREQIVRFTGWDAGIEARAQMWGSYEGGSGTWEWAWNHPHIPDVWKQESCAVLKYGATRGLAPLTTGIIQCPFAEAWQLVIAAAYIVDAEAAYGGPMDGLVVAFGLRELRAIKPAA
jgi:hypothetical protein